MARYDRVEFDSIKYMDSSGGLSCPDSDGRIAYYGINAFPTLVWQGTQFMVGAGTDVIDGDPYDAVIRSRMADATPFALAVTNLTLNNPPAQSSVSVQVTLEANIPDIAGHFIRIFLIEDNLVYGSETYDDVLRDMVLETPLTISQAGQTQVASINFIKDASWVIANLRAAAIVQRDSDRAVLQAATSVSPGDYSFRYYSLGDRVTVGSGTYVFGEFALFNTGLLADSYAVTFDTSGLPEGWTAYFSDGENQYPSLNLNLQPGERAAYAVVMEAGGSGSGTAVLTIHSAGNRTDDRQLDYTLITPDIQVLLVDDDGADNFESAYYGPALATTGRSFAIWPRGAAAVTGDILANFDAVVWNVGLAYPTLDADDRAALTEYLNGGGKLFVSGQDIGWEMNDIGGDAILWYRQTLHALYVADDTNDMTLDGVPGDPIGDGISLNISGGDGANNQDYPSDIDPADGNASAVFSYSSGRYGAVKADTGTYRTVYFSFGYEAINNAGSRALVMQRVMDWLLPDPSGVPVAPAALVLRQNLPNPFNPKTTIGYALGEAGPVTLSVFDVEGRLVRVLDEGPRAAGAHEAVWDGTDAAGRALASGVYFYRLDSGSETATRKMLMLK